MFIQVKTAGGMTALFYQLIHHYHQRRTLALKVGRQQTKYAPIMRGTIKQAESLQKAAGIDSRIFYIMTAVDRLCRTAAFNHGGRAKNSAGNGMRLKKRDG